MFATSPRTSITDTARRAQTHCSELLISSNINKNPRTAPRQISRESCSLAGRRGNLSKQYRDFIFLGGKKNVSNQALLCSAKTNELESKTFRFFRSELFIN